PGADPVDVPRGAGQGTRPSLTGICRTIHSAPPGGGRLSMPGKRSLAWSPDREACGGGCRSPGWRAAVRPACVEGHGSATGAEGRDLDANCEMLLIWPHPASMTIRTRSMGGIEHRPT
ncbi:hypothetical protein, partial [Geminicoccus roseus]|uniref:hypothetical protein n=1 Tax=Geminicoccus roseus TaxID=404900 RepID=UPI001969A4EC